MSSFLPQTSIFEFKESEENQLDFLNAYNEKLEESLDVKEQYELKIIEYQLPWFWEDFHFIIQFDSNDHS